MNPATYLAALLSLSCAGLTFPWSRLRDFTLPTLPLQSRELTCNSWMMLGLFVRISQLQIKEWLDTAAGIISDLRILMVLKEQKSDKSIFKKIFNWLTKRKPHVYGIIYLSLIPLYAILYAYLPLVTLKIPSGSDGFISNFYFSVTTITTLGYGDITPVDQLSQLLTSSESILGIILIGLFLSSLSHQHALESQEIEKKKYEELRNKKELPLKIAAYNDIQNLLSEIQIFWITVHNGVMCDSPPKTALEFFSAAYIHHISYLLDLDSLESHTGKSWWEFIDDELSAMSGRIPTILDRYGHVIEPEIFSMLNDVQNDGMFDPYFMHTKKAHSGINGEEGKLASSRLLSNMTAPNYTFAHLARLSNWCYEQIESFEDMGINWLDKLLKFDAYSSSNHGKSAPNILSKEKAETQLYRGPIPNWSDMYGPRSNKPGNEHLKEIGLKQVERNKSSA